MVQQLLTLSAQTHDELALVAVQYLVAQGYVVEMPGAWETREAFCRRLDISLSRFKRRMRLVKFRPTVELECGPSGRLVRLRSNACFERWMQGAKKRSQK